MTTGSSAAVAAQVQQRAEEEDEERGEFQRVLQQEMDQIQQQQQQEEEEQQDEEISVEEETDEEEEEEEEEVEGGSRFQLTDDERRWATQLKQAALKRMHNDDDDNDNDDNDEDDDGRLLPIVSDFEYVKFAMLYEDDTDSALKSIEYYLQFRQTYGIDNSLEQGLHCIAAWMEQQPGLLLHMDVNAENDPVKVCDPGVLNPKAALANGGRNWKDFVMGMYYFHLACQPNLESVRKGATLLLDFGDVDSSNMNVDVQYQLFAELCSWYPVKINSFMAFNTGFGATMRLSLVKAILPKRISSKIQLGCEINNGEESEDGSTMSRLRQFYLLPTPEEAQHHTLLKAGSLLQQRLQNEHSFTL